jgi:hypothetical protein
MKKLNIVIHSGKKDMHTNPERSKTCRICSSTPSEQRNFPHFGICDKCGYKILIMLMVVLVVVSYMMWFGVF